MIAYAEWDKFSAVVNWTEPVATDNSGLSPKVTTNYHSPQRFGKGAHVIVYTAMDQSGNKATCTFTVVVTGITNYRQLVSRTLRHVPHSPSSFSR